MPEILRTLVLSTAHLPQDVMERVSADDIFGVIVYPNEFGAFVYVPRLALGHIDIAPPDLKVVFDYARQHDCGYVKFDSDGPIENDLPSWDW